MIHSLYMILEWWLMNDDDGSSSWVIIPSWLMRESWMMMIHVLIITELLVIELSVEGHNKSKILWTDQFKNLDISTLKKFSSTS